MEREAGGQGGAADSQKREPAPVRWKRITLGVGGVVFQIMFNRLEFKAVELKEQVG